MFVFEFIYACIYQIDGFAILYLYKQFFLKMLYSIVENWLEFSVNLDFISIPMLFILLTYSIFTKMQWITIIMCKTIFKYYTFTIGENIYI